MKISKTTVERDCVPPTPGELNGKGSPRTQKLYMDNALKGFGVLVSARKKAYIVQRDIKGQTRRVTIGAHGVWTAEQARKEAKALLVRMEKGEDLNQTKRLQQAKSISLAEAAELFLKSPKERSSRTLQWYREKLNSYFKDWLQKPLVDLSRKMVYERHQKIGTQNGVYAANGAMRTFRAIWNRAMKQHEELPICPSINVDWFPEYKRKGIPLNELGKWFKDIQTLSNPIRRDAYLFLLFTGLRAESAATVRWEHVDFEKSILFIPKPKGGEKRAFQLPLSDYTLEILKRRKNENKAFFPNSPWVFPATSKKKGGRIAEWKLSPKDRKQFNVPFTPHALRHTYITAANAAGLSQYDIKLLANHALPKGDVTGGYINPDREVLRVSQKRVADYLLGLIDSENEEKLSSKSGNA